MTEQITGILAIVGCTLVALAGLGVVRFPDLLARMHAATKAPTLGLVCVAAAAALAVDDSRGKLLLAVVLIFVTAPVAAHLVARASRHDPDPRTPPDAEHRPNGPASGAAR